MNTHTVLKAPRLLAAAVSGALVAALLMLSGSAAVAATTWRPPATLAEGAAALFPLVTSSDDGRKLTTVWTATATDNSGTQQVQSRVSADGGATWSATQDLNELDSGQPAPSVAASAAGDKVTVVYLERDNQNIAYVWSRSSRDGGATWDPPVTVSPDVSIDGAQSPQLASSADGSTLVAVWAVTDGVWASVSSDAGGTWGAQRKLSADGAGGVLPVVSISNDGTKMMAAWAGSVDQGQGWQTTVAASTDKGADWGAPQVLAGAGEESNGDVQLAMSADGGTTHIVWSNYTAADAYSVRTARTADAGANWTASTAIGSSKVGPIPTVATSASGSRVYAAWTDGQDATSGIIAARTSGDAGATWAPAANLTSGGKYAGFPQIATSHDGAQATVVWTDGQAPFAAPSIQRTVADTPVIQASSTTDSGTTWEPATNLSDAADRSMFPRLAMSADSSSMIALWNRSDTGLVSAATQAADQTPTVLYALGSAPAPTPTPRPAPVKKVQKPSSPKGRPPAQIKRAGVTVITGRNARTNAGQLIRTRVRCVPVKAAAAGETRYCSVNRGPKGKVSLRTYGNPVRVIVVQVAAPTAEYKAYRKRTVYVDGRKT